LIIFKDKSITKLPEVSIKEEKKYKEQSKKTNIFFSEYYGKMIYQSNHENATKRE